MKEDLRQRLAIPPDRLDALNRMLLDPDTQVINEFLEVVSKYGTPEEINRKATEARQLDRLLERVKKKSPDYLIDLNWLRQERDKGSFVSMSDYPTQRARPAGQTRCPLPTMPP